MNFPANFKTDERFTDQAFQQYRTEHGMHDTVRIGDLPLRALREVLDRAQKLKERAR